MASLSEGAWSEPEGDAAVFKRSARNIVLQANVFSVSHLNDPPQAAECEGEAGHALAEAFVAVGVLSKSSVLPARADKASAAVSAVREALACAMSPFAISRFMTVTSSVLLLTFLLGLNSTSVDGWVSHSVGHL